MSLIECRRALRPLEHAARVSLALGRTIGTVQASLSMQATAQVADISVRLRKILVSQAYVLHTRRLFSVQCVCVCLCVATLFVLSGRKCKGVRASSVYTRALPWTSHGQTIVQ